MLEIRHLSLGDVRALSVFLARIQQCGDDRFFHPHPYTSSAISEILSSPGSDIYAGALLGEELIAYGMLRGWDAGFEIPSLGLAVSPTYRRLGIGQLMMDYLHSSARLRDAETIRLKVHRNNHFARQLYERIGYDFKAQEADEDVGYLRLRHD